MLIITDIFILEYPPCVSEKWQLIIKKLEIIFYIILLFFIALHIYHINHILKNRLSLKF